MKAAKIGNRSLTPFPEVPTVGAILDRFLHHATQVEIRRKVGLTQQ
jgi:hypothetical protein